MATIVIVGEESTNLRLVTLLGDHGHRVLEAADSEQALRSCALRNLTWSSPTS